MGTLLVNGLLSLMQAAINGMLSIAALVLGDVSQQALTAAQAAWVTNCVQVSTAVAAGIFVLYVGYIAVTKYILWNEGTGDTDGGQVWKGVLRVAIYGAAGTYLVYNIFQFGIWYGSALLGQTMGAAVQVTQAGFLQMMALPNLVQNDLVVLVLVFLILVITLIVVFLQMTIRAAELIFFVVGAPVVALGQFNSDGGVWSSWWRSLVVFSLSQTVQFLGIKIIIVSMTAATNTVNDPAGLVLGVFFALGAAVATIAGPHLMKEWSYHTGVGSGVMSGAMFAGQTMGREWIRSSMKG